jgi:hypothetical protein
MISKLRVHCSNWVKQEGRSEEGLDSKRLKYEGSASVASGDMQSSCPWVGRLESLESHRKECPCELVTCEFSACGVKMIRRDLADHQGACRFAQRQCELGCDANVVRFNYDEHLLVCPERQMQCGRCDWRGAQRTLRIEHANECPGALIACDICDAQMLRRDLAKHVVEALNTHVPLLMTRVSGLTATVHALQEEVQALRADQGTVQNHMGLLRSKIRVMTKPLIEELDGEMTPQGTYRVFTFRVPDADRTHYGQYLGFSDSVVCNECHRSSMQIGFVAERVRPHEAQDDQLGRWVGVEFEKNHVPPVRGQLWIRFQVFRSANPDRGASFTHNYNSDGAPLEFDSDRGAKVGDKWGFIWGRSILLTDMAYANALGPHGGLFVRYYIRFVQSQ